MTNLPGDAEFHTLEFSANKRQSGRWSLQGSFAMRWNQDQDTGYFGNNLRSLTTPSTPNDLINTTNGGRYEFTMWTAKVNGSFDAPWGIRLTPALRVQQGQPFGRTFLAGAANGINYGSSASSPNRSTRSGRTRSTFSTCAPRSRSARARRRISVFGDIYNITNSNAAQNIGWNSGVSYLRPVSIIGPRIVRFGMKFDW